MAGQNIEWFPVLTGCGNPGTREPGSGRWPALPFLRPSPPAVARTHPPPGVWESGRSICASSQKLFPSGLAAANFLGFTTQSPRRVEPAIIGSSLPRKLVGMDAVIYSRRPGAWARLMDLEGALLDFLRRGGQHGKLPPKETARKILSLLSEVGRFERLL